MSKLKFPPVNRPGYFATTLESPSLAALKTAMDKAASMAFIIQGQGESQHGTGRGPAQDTYHIRR